MNGIEKPSRLTTVVAQDVYDLFVKYLTVHWGIDRVSHQGVMGMVAQTVLESGHYKYVRNYNLGGIKASSKWKGDWQHFTTREFMKESTAKKYLSKPEPDGKVELINIDSKGIYELRFLGRHSVNKFVSFDSLEAYCEYHIKFLIANYKPALVKAMAGDIRGYGFKLRELGYYTDSAEKYSRDIVSLSKTYNSRIIRNDKLPDVIAPTRSANSDAVLSTDRTVVSPAPASVPDFSAAAKNDDNVIIQPSVIDTNSGGPNMSMLNNADTKLDEKEDVVLPQIGRRADFSPRPWWMTILDFILRLFVKRPMP